MSYSVGSFNLINSSRQFNNITRLVHTGLCRVNFNAGSGTFPVIIQGNQNRGSLYRHVLGAGFPLFFQVNSGGTTSGFVVAVAGSCSYNSASDHRMKENVTDLDRDSALTKILSTRPVTFNWKPEHGGQSGIGFIAHELQEVAPECVSGEKDGTFPNGEIFPQSVDSSWLIPSICAAIDKQQELIEELQSELTLLKLET